VQTVLVYKTSFLQKISDLVRNGNFYYCSGYVAARSAAAFALKFERYYATGLDRHRRARSKLKGLAPATLLMHELNGEGSLFWILLLPRGDNPAFKLERLQNALESRIIVDRFELVRTTAPGTSRPVWTWRLAAGPYAALRASVLDVVRRGDPRTIRQLIISLYRTPGFRGARFQVGKCCALFRGEWKRTRGSEELPTFPRKLFYVSRLKSVAVPLSSWLSAHAVKAIAISKSHSDAAL
jgi:hypothetical protein